MQAVKWGEFKLGDLFEIVGTKSLDSNAIDFTETGINFVGRTFENNGIQGKIQKRDFAPNEPSTITATVIGNYKYVKYQKQPYYCSQNINKLTPRKSFFTKWNEYIAYFCITNIQKFVSLYDGQQGGYKLNDINDFKISLPITENNEIDFDFMESFIRELEEERIRELSAYLTVSGLSDATLTANEVATLQAFDGLEWREFNVTDVFNVKNTHNILSSEIAENSGGVPYLCASTENNGVSSYISYNADFLEDGNCIFIGGKTFVVSYQKDDFFSNDSHNLALYLKDCEADKSNQLYLATCIRKSLAHKYSWGNSISNAKIKGDKVMLPVRNGVPDYAAMQNFISAVQKLVIKDVVKYAEDKINATKKVVKKEVEYKTNEDKSFLSVAESVDYKKIPR